MSRGYNEIEERNPDTTVCCVCGAKINENPKPGTLAFEGFCSMKCRRTYVY